METTSHNPISLQQLNPYLPSSTTTTHPQDQLNSWERWCLERIDLCYAMSQRVKCPFFRRRYGDILDHVEGWVRTMIRLVRPSGCAVVLGPTLACRPVGADGYNKARCLSVSIIMEILRRDWEGTVKGNTCSKRGIASQKKKKGYYVSGKLSSQIYRDDCLFTSPDPDLPIRGLRKYVGIASHLFDSKTSSSELLSLEQDAGNAVILATWRMHLTLRLPWRPQLPSFTGTTTYFLDDEHLIHHHHETWDMDVAEAFWSMFRNNGNRKHHYR